MINITNKIKTHRTAIAQATVRVSKPETMDAVQSKTVPKGDVLEARIGPITIDAETVWHWEKIATDIVLPFEFYPDGWELADE